MTQKHESRIYLGTIRVITKKDDGKGAIYSIERDMKPYISRKHLPILTSRESNSSFRVYVDVSGLNISSLINSYNIIPEFVNHYNANSKHHRLEIEFIPSQESLDLGTPVSEEIEHLTTKNSELQEQLQSERTKYVTKDREYLTLLHTNEKIQTDLDKLSRESQETRQNLEKTLRVHSSKHTLEMSSAKGLESTLGDNRENYILAQEMVIQDAFERIEPSIASRQPYQKPDNVDLALAEKQLANKEKYVTTHGISAIDDLPEQTRNSLLKEWKTAEDIVSEHNAKINSIGRIDVPVRIATIEDKVIISVPVRTGSTEGLPGEIYNSLASYGFSIMQSKEGETEMLENHRYTTLLLKGARPDTISKSFIDFVTGQVGRAYLGVSFRPFTTRYFVNDALNPLRKIDYEPDRVLSEIQKTDIISFIKEKVGKRKIKQFCEEHRLNSGYLYMVKNGKRNIGNKILGKLSEALNISPDEIKRAIM